MRLLMSTAIGITAANAGFGAGLIGSILVGPWIGMVYSAVTVGFAMGFMSMLAAFVATLRGLNRLKYAVLLSH